MIYGNRTPAERKADDDPPRRHRRQCSPDTLPSNLWRILDVSFRTVRSWIANGDLIAHRSDGVVRISGADFRAFLALHREGLSVMNAEVTILSHFVNGYTNYREYSIIVHGNCIL